VFVEAKLAPLFIFYFLWVANPSVFLSKSPWEKKKIRDIMFEMNQMMLGLEKKKSWVGNGSQICYLGQSGAHNAKIEIK